MFNEIDDLLEEWSKDNNLILYKAYKDEEVRSFQYFSSKEIKYQIWIDKGLKKQCWRVNLWDYKKNTIVFEVEKRLLIFALNSSVELANKM